MNVMTCLSQRRYVLIQSTNRGSSRRQLQSCVPAPAPANLCCRAIAGSERAIAEGIAPVDLPPRSNAKIAANEISISSKAETVAEADGRRLFDEAGHVTAWTPSLLLYAPFGLAIAALRMSLWIGGVLLDAPWFRKPEVVAGYLAMLVRVAEGGDVGSVAEGLLLGGQRGGIGSGTGPPCDQRREGNQIHLFTREAKEPPTPFTKQGVTCKWKGLELLPAGRHVMVSNHSTAGDLMVLFQGLPRRYIHLITTAMPPRVVATKNLPCELRFATPEVYEELLNGGRYSNGSNSSSTSGRSSGKASLEASQLFHASVPSSVTMPARSEDEPPVHLFPEGGVTNGRYGMMAFSRGFTRLLRPGDLVVPVALMVCEPDLYRYPFR